MTLSKIVIPNDNAGKRVDLSGLWVCGSRISCLLVGREETGIRCQVRNTFLR